MVGGWGLVLLIPITDEKSQVCVALVIGENDDDVRFTALYDRGSGTHFRFCALHTEVMRVRRSSAVQAFMVYLSSWAAASL